MSRFFDQRFNIRLDEGMREKLDILVNNSQGVYQNRSHVIRCAIIKLYRTEVLKKCRTTGQ